MQIQRARRAPDAQLALAVVVLTVLAILLVQALRPAILPSPGLYAPPTVPAATAPGPAATSVPLSSAAPAQFTTAPAPATLAPNDVPASMGPSAAPKGSSPPRADPSNAGAPNQVAPMDGDLPSVLPKLGPPPKG